MCAFVQMHAGKSRAHRQSTHTSRRRQRSQLSPPLDVGQIGEKVCFVYSSAAQQCWLSPRNMMVLVHHVAHQPGRLPALAHRFTAISRHIEIHGRVTRVWLRRWRLRAVKAFPYLSSGLLSSSECARWFGMDTLFYRPNR